MSNFNSIDKYETLTETSLAEIQGGDLGVLVGIFAAAYVIGSDLARRKKQTIMLSKKEIIITVLYLVYVIFYVLNDMHVLKIGNLPNLLVPTILFLCLKYEIRRNNEHKKKPVSQAFFLTLQPTHTSAPLPL